MHTHNTENRIQDTTIMQHTEDNREQDTGATENTNTPQQNSAHNYRTYSFDLYYEYAYIKNSNTIEIYTISKE